MKKNILIMRHAKSDWSDSTAKDFDRPLNERGLKDAPLMGKLLKQFGINPDAILASSAKRAKQTAELLAKSLNFPNKVTFFDAFYSADEQYIIEHLRRLSSNINTVLIIAHNPTLEDLISTLSSSSMLNIKLPTAAMVSLGSNLNNWDDLDSGFCYLKWFLTPKLTHQILY